MRKPLERVAALAILVSLLITAPARAAGGGEEVGQHVGELLGGWAKSLYAGVAGLVAVVFLLNRRFAELAVFVGAAVVVGGFVLAPGEIAGTVRGIWHTIAG